MPATAVVLTPPMISNLTLTLTKDTANADVDLAYRINWSAFDQLTNLAWTEAWSLVGLDGAVKTTLYTGPILASGISSNRHSFTDRTKSATIPWADLDEDLERHRRDRRRRDPHAQAADAPRPRRARRSSSARRSPSSTRSA